MQKAEGSVSVINAENNTVAATIPVHRRPVAIDLDPTGTLAYVANSGSNTISVIDLKTRREVAQIGTGEEPVALRVSPDGKTLVVANRRAGSVSIADLANLASLSSPVDLTRRPSTRSVRAVFDGCPGANDVVILPDSSKAFVACSAGHQVMAIALARRKTGSSQPDRPSTDQLETFMDVGRAPVQLALKPDGGELFVSNSLSDSISEVVTSTNDVGGAYAMGDDPVRGLVSSDNSMLYIANFRSQWVTVYAPEDGRAYRLYSCRRRTFRPRILQQRLLAVRCRYPLRRCCCSSHTCAQAIALRAAPGGPRPQLNRGQIVQDTLILAF
jgi:YVTN family beta-propeller protein